MPSMSKTTQVSPFRSTSPPVCLSWVSRRASRSSRKSVRRASTGSSVNAAKKRESVERAGSRSRSNNAHVRDGEGLEVFVELLQGALSTDRVARSAPRENRSRHSGQNASAASAHLLSDLSQGTMLAKIATDQHNLAKPGRSRGNGLGRDLDDYRSISDTGHMCLLEGIRRVFPLKEAHVYLCSLPVSSSLRIAWVIAPVSRLRIIPRMRNELRASERWMEKSHHSPC